MENAIDGAARRGAGPVRGLGALVAEFVVRIRWIGVGRAERQSLKLGGAAGLKPFEAKRRTVTVSVIETVTRINDHAITAQRDLDRTVLSTTGDMIEGDLCCPYPESIEAEDVQAGQAGTTASIAEDSDRSCSYDMKDRGNE